MQKLVNLLSKVQKEIIKRIFFSVLLRSLHDAAREQKLAKLADLLKEIVPDIIHQYSTVLIDNPYLESKVRYMHAFQASLIDKVINEFRKPVIVDIGDSMGTHIKYILGLYSKDKDMECISVNLDASAVERIKGRGLKVIQAKGEDLHKYNLAPDILLCFQTLEHMLNPLYFLYNLSNLTNAKYLIVTVPYLRNSRVSLAHIRKGLSKNICAEGAHIFELDPQDWKLIMEHCGWEIVHEELYLQYPKHGILYITRPAWRWFDFEGFYGLILKKDNTWSSRYLDW